MKVGIIGAGSIGLLFASYLNRAVEVTIYTRTAEQAVEINKHGILLYKGEICKKSSVRALPISQWEGDENVTIITVKQYQLEPIIDKISNLSASANNLLFLQNGMGHLKQLESIQSENIFVGSIEHGAAKENNFTVSHNGAGITKVAVFKGNEGKLKEFITAMPDDFPFVFHENFYSMLLGKLVVNAVINPLTSLLSVKNGALIENPYYFNEVQKVYSEIASILLLEDSAWHFEQVVQVCRKTADNRSSMLKDLEAGRPTEVDAILGYLINEAKIQHKEAPLISQLFNLIKGKEQVDGSELV
ncbi:2-dehydropantoate 2-reductase [Bacillus sp. JJ1764]|uniref:2-dehydropantoate 2-reductase n=1 Tax=Bacillus sp. JJ1764 TaxID=3122964 RepID=UPI003000926A